MSCRIKQRDSIIQTIRMLPELLEVEISDVTEAQLITQFLQGEWTVAQIVHHLADAHMHKYAQARQLLSEESPYLKEYDDEFLATLPDADNASVEDSISILTGVHNRFATLLESLKEEDWSRHGRHQVSGAITLEGIARGCAAHGNAHIQQIRATLAAEVPPK